MTARTLLKSSQGKPILSPSVCRRNAFTLDFSSNMNYHSVMNKDSLTNENENQGRGARRKARTRTDLLAAARHVFAARGYHDASIAEITQLADVGVGTFYLHFRDKDEAFHTLLEEGFREMREQITNTLQQGQHRPTIPLVIRTIFRHAYEKRDLF